MTNKLSSLKEIDTYSLVLFALFQLRGDSKYSTLSELVYTLDKESLFNFLDFFGGMTIKVPTKQELQIVIDALILYQNVKLNNTSFTYALNQLGNLSSKQLQAVKETYDKLITILDNYYLNV